MYPDTYTGNLDCIYIISQPTNTYISLTVMMFNIFNEELCEGEYLEIRDGNSEESPLIGKFCGSNIPASMQSTKKDMLLR